jgi:hypothetical protein
MVKSNLRAVTAYYDLGRGRLDGRDNDVYIGWLNRTLTTPLPFTIFLDPAIDPARIAAKDSDEIVQVGTDAFEPFKWKARVETLCATRYRRKVDISYRLPSYGLLNFSKFDMLRKAAGAHDADGFIWIDAGLSRFFEADLAGSVIDAEFLQGATIAVSATPVIHKKNLSRFVGHSRRLVTGGDIYVDARHAADVAEQLYGMVRSDWLDNDLWDNEQVGLGVLLKKGVEGARIIDITFGYAMLFERLLSFPQRVTSSRRRQRLPWFR